MTKLIIAEPVTGLGNRLQSIGSLIRIAKLHGSEFAISWRVNQGGCPAFFQDLFEEPINQLNTYLHNLPTEYFSDDKENQVLHIKAGYKTSVLTQEQLQFPIIHSQAAHLFMLEDSPGKPENRARVIHEVGEILSGFRLNSYVTEQLNIFSRDCDIENRIGVHIRRGDAPIHRQVKLQSFFDFIDKNYAGALLFVATDDQDALHSCKEKFGHQMVSFQARSRNRNCRISVQDALVELLLLSRTQRIVAGMSSFSAIAAMIGQVARDVLPAL